MVSQVNRTRVSERNFVGDTTGKELAMTAVPKGRSSSVTGAGASAGIASGRAKVVCGPAEMNKVEPGDVLVCEMMTPVLTALLSKVSAIVADRGGILSNGAVIAREYGLPCVVQTVVGTSVIRDRQLLTVDGSRGVVCVDSSPTE